MRAFTIILAATFTVCASAQSASAQPDQAAKDFELVEKIGTRRAYEVFLQTHPTGAYAQRVRKLLLTMPPEPRAEQKRTIDHGRKTEPNWGDDVLIPRLMKKQGY